MSEKKSTISYVPQPYFASGPNLMVGTSNVSSITNIPGVFAPDLSDYTTVVATASSNSFSFSLTFSKQSAYLSNCNMSLAFLGCAMLTYEDDGFGAADLATEFSENISLTMSSTVGTSGTTFASFAHNSQDSVTTFNKQPMPGIISGGTANLVFNAIGTSSTGTSATVNVSVERVPADVTARPHAHLILGHLYIAVDLPVYIMPQSFAWTLEVANQRFVSKDFGAVNSDGTIVKRSSGEFYKILQDDLLGTNVTGVGPITANLFPNFFDLSKSHTSYAILLNPYPAGGIAASTLTVEQSDILARQNYFSIYGFLSDPLEFLIGDYRDGINSEYRARYRIVETR